MLRPVVMIGALGILAASALGLTLPSKLGAVGPISILHKVPDVDNVFVREFRGEFLTDINHSRFQLGIENLASDQEIEGFLSDFLGTDPEPESIDLNTVFDALQAKFPGAQYLAANLVSASSRNDLKEQLKAWDELAHPEFQEVSTSVVKSGRRLISLSVLSRRIPRFSINGANNGGGRFYNQCPHCTSIHALDLDRKNKTLILSCPDCDRPYDVLAADPDGNMRRANKFFTQFQVPLTGTSARKSKKHQVLAIWNEIANRCSYEHDHLKYAESEVWKTSDDTWLQKQGDCEDTSILLVDALLSAGFDARVAIGWNGNIGQHAWVVVNLDGEQFVIESTIQENPRMEDMVPVKEAAPFYRPEQLFDRDHLYFQNAAPDRVAANYFDESTWKKVHWD